MNKKLTSLALAGVMAVGAWSLTAVGTVSAADAADVTPTTVTRQEGQSMVLSMREVAGIFLGKYPNSAIHSISLKPDKGRFAYVVEGYTLKKTYKLQIDVITSKIIKETVDDKEKDIPNRIFNPLNVMEPKKAEAIAVAQIGEGALSKGWEVKAENGEVTYVVAVYRNGEKVDITLNAVTGDILSVSEPEPMIISDDGADAEVEGEDTWFVPKQFR
ncbi:PepSY domain-containing protein [uncultured Veillonella sp.]|uniref:PepSY domain-containing protein n=1 Tax=uncultured Veillonella sp. TaxID=159268 RepID=UPI00262C97F5|nr:PepSY domain-containing protein [uncultured Veillonella sp.]